jgi:ferredoxin
MLVRVALGQSKMVVRPIAGILHIIVYAGFVIINIEVLEILIDGLFGTHRVLSFTGALYDFLIASFEWLALGVLLACVVFLVRRNGIRLKRFLSKELDGWPRSDANIILFVEILLMSAFLLMNAADGLLQNRAHEHYHSAGSFPVSSWIMPALSGISDQGLIFIERFCWWFHIIGILAFMNYLPYSKHFHILLSFPATYFSNLKPKGEISNLESVTREVKLMLDPSAASPPAPEDGAPQRFGAKDVFDLNWKQLLDAYTCTECGRCTSSCPANQTGKLLSPRKILMDTRDRLDEVGRNMDANGGNFSDDGKSLLGSYISEEELWACNTCNACTEACPVNLDPLSVIVDLRRYLIMEQSAAPGSLNMMFTNVENNGAPWQFSPSDRLNWANEQA